MGNNALETNAYHESGHAVIMVALGEKPDRIEVQRDICGTEGRVPSKTFPEVYQKVAELQGHTSGQVKG